MYYINMSFFIKYDCDDFNYISINKILSDY